MRTRTIWAIAALILSCGTTSAQMPLSAIDWLSENFVDPATDPVSTQPQNEWILIEGADPEVISVTPITAATTDSVGLLSANATGLPHSLWGSTESSEIANLLSEVNDGLLPSMQRLLFVLLLAEVAPPIDGDANGKLFLARVDSLVALGAVEQAQALLERAGPDDSERFRRWFDVSLLTGTERVACARLLRRPGLMKSLSARIFCLARGGDWSAAALTLAAGRALGAIDEVDAELLTRFLTPDMDEYADPLPTPMRPSPLAFRIHEAIGEPLPTTTLPRAFAQADLRSNVGWKAQIEAAERLAQTGAVSANLLLGLYTKQRPAASGGVWNRSAAIQRFDTAIRERNPDMIADSLPEAWQAMRYIGLEAFLAQLYAEDLRTVELRMPADSLAYRLMLLSKEYEAAAVDHLPVDADERFLQAVAQGYLTGVAAPNELARAIADGFHAPRAPDSLARLVERGELGAAILYAVRKMRDGETGNFGELAEAIALFRAIGLEDVARRAALEAMILDRRA